MSVTLDLRASARATYRLLFRTAANTFRGDDRVLAAFREKVRNEFREGRSLADATAYNARIQLGREIADVLKKNVVQGVKVERTGGAPAAEAQLDSTMQNKDGVWRLRLTEDTELGSNDTVKSSARPAQTSGEKRSCCQSAASAFSSSESAEQQIGSMKERVKHESNEGSFHSDNLTNPQAEPPRNLNFSALRRASQGRIKPELNENDLEESFVRGSGPGGQSINKTSNNVQLLHKPTGIRVSCQETRSLQTNRMIARNNLIERLDQIANPGLSKEDMKRAKQVERERRRRKKAKKKARAKTIEEVVEDSK